MTELIKTYLDRLGKNWNTVPGLRDHSILIIALIVVAVIPGTGYRLYILIAGLVFLTLLYSAWNFKRLIKFIIFNKINIIFCFYNVSGSIEVDEHINNLQSEFLARLQNFNLKRIKIYFLPTDRRILSRNEAEGLIQQGYNGQSLIVWGEFTKTHSDIKCRTTNFTYEFSVRKYLPHFVSEKIQEWFVQETQESVNCYNWNFNLKNRVELESYADNVKDIAVYTLARTLLSVGKVDDSIEMLTNLLNTLENTPYHIRINRGSIISAIKNLLGSIYFKLADESFYKKNWNRVELHLNDSLRFDPRSYPSNILMAYFHEVVKDDEVKSRYYLNVAGEHHMHGQNAHLLCNAYFEFKNERFEKAIEIYRMLKRSIPETNLVMLAENLRESYEKSKSLQFLFAEGFVKYVWLGDNSGKVRLRRFLKVANQEKFKVLREEAGLVLGDPEYKNKRFKPKNRRSDQCQ